MDYSDAYKVALASEDVEAGESLPRHLAEKVRFTADKAIAGAVTGGLYAGLTAFATAVEDGVIDLGDLITIGLALLGGAGIIGGTVYGVTNHVK